MFFYALNTFKNTIIGHKVTHGHSKCLPMKPGLCRVLQVSVTLLMDAALCWVHLCRCFIVWMPFSIYIFLQFSFSVVCFGEQIYLINIYNYYIIRIYLIKEWWKVKGVNKCFNSVFGGFMLASAGTGTLSVWSRRSSPRWWWRSCSEH